MLQKSEFESLLELTYLILNFLMYSELATYHHDAPYKSQTCSATYMLSRTVLRKHQKYHVSDDDVDMDEEPASTQENEEDDDGDYVPEVKVIIVNETDLEGIVESFFFFAQGV
jgi:DNA polymerase delta subunit 3